MDTTENRYSPRPAFSIEIEGNQLMALDNRLISLSLTDNRGFEADTLDLTLDDADGQIALPPRGAKISVALGWDNDPLVFKGVYTVDEIGHAGPPDQLPISARSADFRDTFNVKREYSWHDITVGDVVASIASRYDLRAGVSEELAKIEIEHADQTSESDISFLTRMAEMLGAVATIKNGMLLFITLGKGVMQSGKPLPVIEIVRSSGDKHRFNVADRDACTGVTAYWLDLNFGKKPPADDEPARPKRKSPHQAKKRGIIWPGPKVTFLLSVKHSRPKRRRSVPLRLSGGSYSVERRRSASPWRVVARICTRNSPPASTALSLRSTVGTGR